MDESVLPERSTMFPSLSMIALVAAGGAAGSVLRYTAGFVLSNIFGTAWPYGTIAANLCGSFLIGFIGAGLAFRCPDPRLAAFLIAGFLGGFTTFSSFVNETLQLYLSGQWLSASLYMTLQTGSGVGAAALGLTAARCLLA